MRILIADDERTSRVILRKFLTDSGHEVEDVADGVAALRRLRRGIEEIDLLILDIMMPEMDGLTLLEVVHKRHPLLPIIMLTAAGDRAFVKRALKLGASDFLDKPVRREDLVAAIREVMNNAAKKTLSDSLRTSMAVREVQSKLLDNLLCEKCSFADAIHFWFRPIADAGGDFFLCRKGGDFCQFIVADVAGHDVKSSYTVAELRGVIDGLGADFRDPGELLSAINRVFVSRGGDGASFVCALCAFVDFSRGEWRLANAGFPYPLLRRVNGDSHWLRIGGNMLGVLDKPSFESVVFAADKGDRLLVFSDGLEEVVAHSRIYSDWVSAGMSARSLREDLDALVKSNSLTESELKDDILILGLEQTLAPDSSGGSRHDLCVAWEVAGILAAADDAAVKVAELVAAYFDNDEAEKAEQAVAGLLRNAVEYGNRGRKRIPVGLLLSIDKSAGRLHISVSDAGDGFDLDTAVSACPNGFLHRLRGMAESLVADPARATVTVILSSRQN